MLDKILKAKENRASLRILMAKNNLASISLSLNIAGYPKSDAQIHQFFNLTLNDLKRYLLANRIFIDTKNAINQTDEAGDFYLAPILSQVSVNELKTICEEFEESNPLGRLIDVDITDNECNPVSSGKAKVCYYCKSKPAIVCMRERNHSYEELRNFISENIKQYLEERRKREICRKLSSKATKSIIYEFSLTPKPGLVDKLGSGSHNDMDYNTFVDSTSAISVYFYDLAKAGYEFQQTDYKKALPIIRNIGLQMENSMFQATNGVNTQKGIIFLMGLCLFAAANVLSKNEKFTKSDFQKTVQNICSGMVERELTKPIENETHGENCYKTYKTGGARAEAETGFPTVFNFALPILEKNNVLNLAGLKNPQDLNDILIKTLLTIISVNEDTNILHRSNVETLKKLQNLAASILSNYNSDEYQKIIDFCKEENISPGGSADLLAISLFIHLIS